MDFRSDKTVDKQAGRLEERTITVSSMLNDYLNWLKLGQVFKLEPRVTTLYTGKVICEVQYGLTEEKASPKRLLEIVRSEWGIENGLHYRRDVTYAEDETRMTKKTMVVSLLNGQGFDNHAQQTLYPSFADFKKGVPYYQIPIDFMLKLMYYKPESGDILIQLILQILIFAQQRREKMKRRLIHLWFSIFSIISISLGVLPPQVVKADNAGEIDGKVYLTGITEDLSSDIEVIAYAYNGSYCTTKDPISPAGYVGLYVDPNTGIPVPGEYEFSIMNCDTTQTYEVTARGRGWAFDSQPVTNFSGGVATDIVNIDPLTRKIHGKVIKTDGQPWANFDGNPDDDDDPITTGDTGIEYTLDESTATLHHAQVDGNGSYSIEILDTQSIAFNVAVTGNANDGYWFSDDHWSWDHSGYGGDKSIQFNAHGERYLAGRINGNGSCINGVTITATTTDANVGVQTVTATTDVYGSYWKTDVEPALYDVTAVKTGCSYAAPIQADLTLGNVNNANFDIATGLTIAGQVNLKDQRFFGSIADKLIVTYTPNKGSGQSNGLEDERYQAMVNIGDHKFQISGIPANPGGTLRLWRAGGNAAFGYCDADATHSANPNKCNFAEYTISPMSADVNQDFLLSPNRLVSGTIVGTNGVPFPRGTEVDFGFGLFWAQNWAPGATGTGTAFSVFAQPIKYILSPAELMIDSPNGTVNRKVVDATLPVVPPLAWAPAFRKVNLQGCIFSQYGEAPVSATPLLQSNRGTTATYAGTLYLPGVAGYNTGCGNNPYYKILGVPLGVAGNFVVAGHDVKNPVLSIEQLSVYSDNWFDLVVMGQRKLTGKVLVANPNVDLKLWENLKLSKDATYNPNNLVFAERDTSWQQKEFVYSYLEPKTYTLRYTEELGGSGMDIPGFYFGSAPYDPSYKDIAVNLLYADQDIITAPNYIVAKHEPITEVKMPVFGGSGVDPTDFYTDELVDGDEGQTSLGSELRWLQPEENPNDKIWWYEYQYGITMPTDGSPMWYTSPSRDAENPVPVMAWAGNLPAASSIYWRARAVYEYDKGDWTKQDISRPLKTPPGLSVPANNAIILPSAANPVTFTWTKPAYITSTTVKYDLELTNIDPDCIDLCVIHTYLGNVITSSITPPSGGAAYTWRVRAFEDVSVNGATTGYYDEGIDKILSGWSLTNTFFYKVFPPTPLDVDFDFATGLGLVQFSAKDRVATNNDNLNDAAVDYQVQFALNGVYAAALNDSNSVVFMPESRTGGGFCDVCEPKDISSLPNGLYKWRIRLLYEGIPASDWNVWLTTPVLSYASFLKPVPPNATNVLYANGKVKFYAGDTYGTTTYTLPSGLYTYEVQFQLANVISWSETLDNDNSHRFNRHDTGALAWSIPEKDISALALPNGTYKWRIRFMWADASDPETRSPWSDWALPTANTTFIK